MNKRNSFPVVEASARWMKNLVDLKSWQVGFPPHRQYVMICICLCLTLNWMKNLSDPKSWQVGFPPQPICYDEPLATHATTNTRRILDLDPALVRCSSIENSTKPQCLPMGLQAAFISPRKRKGNIGSSVSNKEGSIFQLVLKKILIQFFFFLTEGRSEIVLSTATCHFQSSV